MLLVSTCQVRHPILCLILVKTDDLALHCRLAGAPGSVMVYE